MKIGTDFAKHLSITRLGILAGAIIVASAAISLPASADDAITNCGAPIQSIVKSRFNAPYTTHSATFVTLANHTAARLAAGSHTIQMQAATDSNVVLTLENWTFSVETAK